MSANKFIYSITRNTAPTITKMVHDEFGVAVSERHTGRVLSKNGLLGRIAVKKPLLRATNKEKRLAFALAHRDWTVADWKKSPFH